MYFEIMSDVSIYAKPECIEAQKERKTSEKE